MEKTKKDREALESLKVFLQENSRLARGIRFKRERVIELRNLVAFTRKISEEENAAPQQNTFTNCLRQIEEWEREIETDLGNLCKGRTVIAGVKNTDYRQLLELRYIDGYAWPEVADKMHYTERHIYNLHNRALKAILEGENSGVAESFFKADKRSAVKHCSELQQLCVL